MKLACPGRICVARFAFTDVGTNHRPAWLRQPMTARLLPSGEGTISRAVTKVSRREKLPAICRTTGADNPPESINSEKRICLPSGHQRGLYSGVPCVLIRV